MKRPHEMTFKEFAEAVKPSAGMNRWPQIGDAQDVSSYSVYMNGETADFLPPSVREQEFRDVVLHALTEKIGLDPLSMRDNIKVAEVLAMRHAYMTTVLEASMAFHLSPEVQQDYELLTNQMSHPLIKNVIEQQRALSYLLQPVLDEAAKVLGQPVDEREAAGVSRGAVISQNEEFTVQDIGNGRVVAHENRRLEAVPAIGQEVTVAYYRGKGQVLDDMQSLTISEAYVDQATGDLAVKLIDGQGGEGRPGEVKRVVLFNSMAMLAEFATENELGRDFVARAMDARAASPKLPPARMTRTVAGEPYIDAGSGSLALDYLEGPVKYTAIFPSIDEFKVHAKAYGASEHLLRAAELLPVKDAGIHQDREQQSFEEANRLARIVTADVQRPNEMAGRYTGPVIATTALHVIQDIGRGAAVIHDKCHLDKVPLTGEKLAVAYNGGRGEVQVREAAKERDRGR